MTDEPDGTTTEESEPQTEPVEVEPDHDHTEVSEVETAEEQAEDAGEPG